MPTLGRPALLALVALFSLLWSSAFVAGKVAVAELTPVMTLVLRFAISVVVMLPFCLASSSLLFDRRIVWTASLLGVLNNAIYLGFTFSALQFTSPAAVIVIVSCAPFITALLAAVLGIERLSMMKCAGIIVGILGVGVISSAGMTFSDLGGMGLALIGTVAFACATVLFRDKSKGLPVLLVNFWQSVAGAVALLPVLVLQDVQVPALSMPTIAALVYLALVATIGGMALWLFLIRVSGASSASSYHLLNPVFGVLLSYAVFGTPMKLTDFIGAAIIAAGLALTMLPGRKDGDARAA
jgi:drug/metabolite transporter (DMT)-like permease